MFGREIRTRWKLLSETTSAEEDKKQKAQTTANLEKRKKNYGGRARKFEIGNRVYIKDFSIPHKPTWNPAVIVQKLGRSTYRCQIPSGEVWKRHVDQIKSCHYPEDRNNQKNWSRTFSSNRVHNSVKFNNRSKFINQNFFF